MSEGQRQSATELIRIESLAKTYGDGANAVHALRGISLSILPGEFVAIVGASGSGKSTLMNLLGCLDRPTSGRYFLDGRDVSTLSRNQLAEVRSAFIGFVFQSFHLLPRATALQNVALPLQYVPGLAKRERMGLGREALARVRLSEKEGSRPNQLSGGQQQRVAIARALVNRPRMLLADEPTGNLDTRTSFQILELLQDLNAAGQTILIVTHEKDVASCARRIVRIRDGKLASDETNSQPLAAADALAALPPEPDEAAAVSSGGRGSAC